ncbi:MAG: S41 family peptidase [Rikenellaceae bacterium]
MRKLVEITLALAFFSIFTIGCTNKIEVSDPFIEVEPEADQEEVESDYTITSSIDNLLTSIYLYNDEYKTLDRNTSLRYDIFFSTTLMSMKTNALDLKTNDSGSYLHSSVARVTSSATKSSIDSSYDYIVSSYGFHSIELFNYSNNKWVNVKNVFAGSDADNNGVKRGSVITHINGTQIGSMSNISSTLLYPSLGSNITLTLYGGESITLTAKSTTASPIMANEIYEIGEKKIGLLSYTRFNPNFDTELANAFATFSSAQITDLILDLRLNSGGNINTGVDVTSMIAGDKAVDKTILNLRFNTSLTDDYENTETKFSIGTMEYNPENSLFKLLSDNVAAGNRLNLSTKNVYCIVTDDTASVSELVINSLRGLGFEVTIIGDTRSYNDATNGKNVGSVTYHQTRGSYTYYIFATMYEIFNTNGEGGYENGFKFDHKVNEYNSNWHYTNYGQDEPLIAKAIELITGTTRTATANSHSAAATDSSNFKVESYRIQGDSSYNMSFSSEIPLCTE